MKPSNKTLPWLIWAIPTAFYALVCMFRVASGVLMDNFLSHYQISYFEFSLLPALYYVGYAAMQIPVSLATDRFSLKIIMPALMLISGLGAFLLVGSSCFPMAALGSFLLGIGTTIAILGASSIINDNFSKTSYGFIFGLTLTSGLLAGAYAGRLISNFLLYFSWKEFYYMSAILCGIYAVLSIIFLRNQESGSLSKRSMFALKELITNKFLLLITLYGALMTGTIQGFADVWGKAFLSKKFALSEMESIIAVSSCFFGYAISAPIIGKLAQKYNKIQFTIVLCGMIMVVSLSAVIYSPVPLSGATIRGLLFVAGIGSSFPTLTFALILQKVDKSISNTAIGLSNMGLMAFGFLYHVLIGKFYSINPLLAISIVPAGILIGAAGMSHLFIKDKAI